MTDIQKIKRWFKANKFLTVNQAIHKLGVYNARSRMSEIPHFADMIEVVREDGRTARVARYWL